MLEDFHKKLGPNTPENNMHVFSNADIPPLFFKLVMNRFMQEKK